jgi:hypothetical protein
MKRRARRPRVTVAALANLKGALTVAGDIRSDIEFQNDVNALLAAVSRLTGLRPTSDVVVMPGAEVGFAPTVEHPPHRRPRGAAD